MSCEQPLMEIIDDIEDLISAQDITPKERYSSRKHVKVKARKRIEDEKENVTPIGVNIPVHAEDLCCNVGMCPQ
ncbi:hypothetical protein NQ318_023066 [Aromia moschata]|uniref:Uncharacterized protein n=1 Tax=Aromia moschata TaxID=1265417 RepID=A0AAV8X4L3_9CUCU|nr:hypothetical protein NQ318_023066 [Aromia moschata]